MIKFVKNILLPLIIVICGVASLIIMTKLKGETHQVDIPDNIPLVEVEQFEPVSENFYVSGRGTVRPVEEINLISQVQGEIIYMSKNMLNGSFFKKGETLIKIDPAEYALQVESAKAQVVRTEVQLKIEQEEAKIAKQEWNNYNKKNKGLNPGALTLREPQLELATANLNSANAQLDLANLNLQKTVIKAPFSGRVVMRNVSKSQFVNRGTMLAKIYSTEKFEIVVPIQNSEVAWLNVPRSDRKSIKPIAIIKSEFGGKNQTWLGKLVRDEAQLNNTNRMVNLIVEVENTISNSTLKTNSKTANSKADENNNKTFIKEPSAVLLSGMFVNVSIEGKNFNNIYKIPRHLMHDGSNLLVVLNNEIQIKKVNILRFYDGIAAINEGIEKNDQIVSTRLDFVTPRMKVKVVAK